jgi:glycosyltransferase involved in cell wall biosynthesis
MRAPLALEIAFSIPGDIDQPTGGYGYARAVIAAAPALGARIEVIRLPDGFPFQDASVLAETERLLTKEPPERAILFDGLAYGALPAELLKRLNRRWVALCHHPLALETGLAPETADILRRSEIAALAEARAVIVTSAATGELVIKEFGVPPALLTVAPPGVARRPRAKRAGSPPHLLAVGSLVPRKGYDLLIQALARLRDRNWRCSIVGALDRDPAAVEAIRAEIDAAGLSHRVTLTGALQQEALDQAYAEADVFVHAAYFEGYGMAVADALAAGLPVVAAAAAATSALVPPTAGLLFPVGDAEGLTLALAALLDEPGRAATLADGAWIAGRSLPDWPDTTEAIITACRKVTA